MERQTHTKWCTQKKREGYNKEEEEEKNEEDTKFMH